MAWSHYIPGGLATRSWNWWSPYTCLTIISLPFLSFYSDIIRGVIDDVLASFVVLPNRISIPLTDVDPYKLKYPMPDVSSKTFQRPRIVVEERADHMCTLCYHFLGHFANWSPWSKRSHQEGHWNNIKRIFWSVCHPERCVHSSRPFQWWLWTILIIILSPEFFLLLSVMVVLLFVCFSMRIVGAKTFKTKTKDSTLNPVWNEVFEVLYKQCIWLIFLNILGGHRR